MSIDQQGVFKIIFSLSFSDRTERLKRHANNDSEPENCTKAAIEEFPRDFLSPEQRQKGGIVIHILIAAYLIWSLGIICDDYFVPVLEIICEALHLAPDVAGATFMAAGEKRKPCMSIE